MLSDRVFWYGVIVGLAVPVAIHYFVKPMPTKAGG